MLELLRGIGEEVVGSGKDGCIYIDDAVRRMEALSEEAPGSVSLIYMDPPYGTGKRFEVRQKVGAREWKSGRGSLVLPAYDDKLPRDEYLSMMRSVLTSSKKLLSSDGLLFIHVDYRMHAHIRLLADEIFGESSFLNEIVWAYETGGRSKKVFARKHDIILLYASSEDYDLHTDDVAEVPEGGRRNHMARRVDEDGRTYRQIVSGGKLYRYYDDEPVPPSDVWSDISHLQQRDPQRSGFDTQKPYRLLDRIVRCASREGDTVLDPFFGSGTTLEAAFAAGRKFIGIDINPLCAVLAERRLKDAQYRLFCPEGEDAPELDALAAPGITDTGVYLNAFEPGEGELGQAAPSGYDGIDNWAAGRLENGVFLAEGREIRSKNTPELTGEVRVPLPGGGLVVRVSDILGRRFFYRLQN